jgi:phosphatidylinositol alpha 1,6-mannosyltransferase
MLRSIATTPDNSGEQNPERDCREEFTTDSRVARALRVCVADRRSVQIALVAETFLPATNGVVNSVLRVADELTDAGHSATILAPDSAPSSITTRTGVEVEVRGIPSMELPGYRGLHVCRPGGGSTAAVRDALRDIRPDVVHLASPLMLGKAGAYAARDLGIPAVSIFQTDLSGFLHRYHLRAAGNAMWTSLRKVHNLTALTLAPSTATACQLNARGIGPVEIWGRGVDTVRFDPHYRSPELRRRLLGGKRLLVGFVGRLAPEKRCELLAEVAKLPDVQLVVIGDGPRRAKLQKLMPQATFAGMLGGVELSRHIAALDLLVNPGADETFCQVVQEALASGVPVVAAACGGPLDLVRHRDNGWLWSGDDPKVLAAMVAARRDDRGELAAVARNARPSVAGRTWTELTTQLIGHYHRAMGASVTTYQPPTTRPAMPSRVAS